MTPSNSAPRTATAEPAAPAKVEYLLFICTLLSVLAVLISCWRLILFPYQIDYGEGSMLEGALSLRQGQPLYPVPFRGLPIVLHVYGPLAYAATAASLHWPHVSFTPGRILILFCALAVSALISFLLRREIGPWQTALTFGLTLIALPAFRFWAYLLRADLIGIAVSVSGLALFATKPRYKHCSVPFFAAAILCKYTLLAAPLTALLYLVITRQIKEAARFVTLLVLTVGSLFAVLQIKTGGGFAFHMFSTHADPYSLTKFAALTAIVWFSAPLVTGLAVFHVVRSMRSGKSDLAGLFFLAASTTSLSAGKLGATTNHFLEWMVAACLCAGMGYDAVKREYPRKLLPITIAMALTTAIGVFLQNRPAQQPYLELSECSQVYDYVANMKSSRILSQSLGPLLLAHKPVLVTDLFAYNHLVQRHLWFGDTLVRSVDEHYFGAILTTVDPEHVQADAGIMWPPSLLDAISCHYHVVKRLTCRDSSLVLEPGPT